MQSSKTKPGSPLQSTRQMLDELDALMERMLALPVGDAEDLPPLPRDLPALPPQVTATLTAPVGLATLEEPGTLPEGAAEPMAPALEEVMPPPETAAPPKMPRQERPRVDSGDTMAGPHFAASEVPPSPDLTNETASREEAAEDLSSRTETPLPMPAAGTTVAAGPSQLTSLPLLPLLWVNLAFDACSGLLGPVGEALRGQRGRNVLGMVGLCCLGIATAWLIFDQISGR